MGNERVLQNVLDGRRKYLSKIQGCLAGGAAGDALGYSVEFMRYRDIRQTFGPNGITDYELTNGKAQISDDTQMTLFTANGLLYGETCKMIAGSDENPHNYIPDAYRDWLYTQDKSYKPEKFTSWLVSIPELNNRRAPGTTCLTALRSGKTGLINEPLNNSCGCGGVMRAAPVGLFYGQYYDSLSDEDLVRYGAESAAITHGHPWGYIPAGMLALIIKKAVFSSNPLPEIIHYSLDVTGQVFRENGYWEGFESLILKSIECAANGDGNEENIRKLGEGWVGHEALAIAVYCALRYQHDFSNAIIAAVNHNGDSDSTGSICGNIIGAFTGMDGIEKKWLEKLELIDTIMEIGKDLCDHCQMNDRGEYNDPVWTRKYVEISEK